MKRLFASHILGLGLVLGSFTAVVPSQIAATEIAAVKIGFVSARQCVETSKFGKAEQENFDKLKKQLEQAIELKEKELNDLAPKFSDEYLDTLTPQAEKELKEKFKNLSQDLSVQQNQYYQTLNEVNYKQMQMLLDKVAKASTNLAKKMGFQFILNDETCFYRDGALDATKEVIAELDSMFDSEKK